MTLWKTLEILRKAMSLEGLFEVCWFATIIFKQHCGIANMMLLVMLTAMTIKSLYDILWPNLIHWASWKCSRLFRDRLIFWFTNIHHVVIDIHLQYLKVGWNSFNFPDWTTNPKHPNPNKPSHKSPCWLWPMRRGLFSLHQRSGLWQHYTPQQLGLGQEIKSLPRHHGDDSVEFPANGW